MAAHHVLRHVAVAVLLATVPAVPPRPTVAVESIPVEHAGRTLPGRVVTAVVGDVTGNGTRELVRLVPRASDPAHLAVDVVTTNRSGARGVYEQVDLRRSHGVDEVADGRVTPDAEGKVPARMDEPARLLVWREAGRERVLAVAIGSPDGSRACCLTVWEVRVRGSATTLTLRADLMRSADHLRVADLDGDGTDEIVVRGPVEGVRPNVVPIYVMRWSEGRFEAQAGSLAPADDADAALLPLGDSDGRPGEEVGVVARSPGAPATVLLHRIGLDDAGSLRVESAALSFAGQILPMPAPEGGLLVLAAPAAGAVLVSWPAGAPRIVERGRSARQGLPLAVLGSGTSARLLQLRGDSLDVLDADLVPVDEVVAGPAAATFRGTELVPYVGPVPGGLPIGVPAYLFGGRLLHPPASGLGGAEEPLTVGPTATLPSMTPIGVFGPEGRQAAVAADSLDATREGGQMVGPAGPVGGMDVYSVPTASLLAGEAEQGVLQPSLVDAVPGSQPASPPELHTRADFEMRVVGPPGTRVLLYTEDRPVHDASVVIGRSGATTVKVASPTPLTDQNVRYTVRILAVTPSGHGYGGAWLVRVLRQPPPIEAAAPMAPLSFDVPLSGRTSPGTTMLVDDREVAVGTDGSFSTRISVGILPQRVVLRAVDQLGNASSRTISVVGFFDYARLPWIQIVVVLTLMAGAALYLRAPRPAASAARQSSDDGLFEEIE